MFLKKLESNNNRNWFLENKGTFKSLKQVKHFKQIICDNLNAHDKIENAKIFAFIGIFVFQKAKLHLKHILDYHLNAKLPYEVDIIFI